MRCVALLALLSVGSFASDARGDVLPRGVIAPTADAPVRVSAGRTVTMVVRVASGLTPPPGIQTERALRGFAARVCDPSEPTPEAARCTTLTVRNVRPTDAHSLVYRVEAPLPPSLPEGTYDLELRFPGGSSRVRDGLRVVPAEPSDSPLAATLEPGAPSAVRCATSGSPGAGGATGLLLLALSWKLAASRRARRWNSVGATLVSEGP